MRRWIWTQGRQGSLSGLAPFSVVRRHFASMENYAGRSKGIGTCWTCKVAHNLCTVVFGCSYCVALRGVLFCWRIATTCIKPSIVRIGACGTSFQTTAAYWQCLITFELALMAKSASKYSPPALSRHRDRLICIMGVRCLVEIRGGGRRSVHSVLRRYRPPRK